MHLHDNAAFEYFEGPGITFGISSTKGFDRSRISNVTSPLLGGFTVNPLPSGETLEVVLENVGSLPGVTDRPYADYSVNQVTNNSGRLIFAPTELNYLPQGTGKYYRPKGPNAGPSLQIAVNKSTNEIILNLTDASGTNAPVSYPIGSLFFLYGSNGLDGRYKVIRSYEDWSVMQPVDSQIGGAPQVVDRSFYLSVLKPGDDWPNPEDRK